MEPIVQEVKFVPSQPGFFQEAWERLWKKTPTYIVKWQVILGAIGTAAATMAAISWPGKLATVGEASSYAVAVCGGGVAFMQLAVKVFGITLPSGGAVVNATPTPVELPVTTGNPPIVLPVATSDGGPDTTINSTPNNSVASPAPEVKEGGK